MSIITITSGTKSGGRALAEALSKKLGYKSLSREVILASAKKYNIMEEDLFNQLMETPSLWQKLFKEKNRYPIYVQCSLLEAAQEDNIIYHGLAGQFFLRGIGHVLKVRLEAPLEYRIKHAMEEFSKTRGEAEDYIKKMDEQRREWVKFLYDENWYNPTLYDLALNLDNMSIESACNIVVHAVNRKAFQTSEESKKRLADISLACEVKAAIASDDMIWHQPITVTADKGVVTLKGTVKNEEMRDAVADVASMVKGVTDVKPQIDLSSDPWTR